LDALHNGRFPGLGHVPGLDHALRSPGPGDAESTETALVALTQRLIRGDYGVVGVDPLRQVPQPVATAPGDRDLAAHHHELEHLAGVAVVPPAGRFPRTLARVRKPAGRQRPIGPEPLKYVHAACVIVAYPTADPRPPAGQFFPRGVLPARHVRSV